MYTLRTVKKNGLNSNYELGKNYSTIMNRKAHPTEECLGELDNSEFKRELSLHSESQRMCPDYEDVSIIGFVISEEFKSFPIFRDENVFVMTESGKTFSRLN